MGLRLVQHSGNRLYQLKSSSLNKYRAIAHVNNAWYYIKCSNLSELNQAFMTIGTNPPTSIPAPSIPIKHSSTVHPISPKKALAILQKDRYSSTLASNIPCKSMQRRRLITACSRKTNDECMVKKLKKSNGNAK